MKETLRDGNTVALYTGFPPSLSTYFTSQENNVHLVTMYPLLESIVVFRAEFSGEFWCAPFFVTQIFEILWLDALRRLTDRLRNRGAKGVYRILCYEKVLYTLLLNDSL
jgi:hypothetical protein